MAKRNNGVSADMAFIRTLVAVSKKDDKVTKYTFTPTPNEMSVTLEDDGATDRGSMKWPDVVARQLALYDKMRNNPYYASVWYDTSVVGAHVTQEELDRHINA